MKDAASRWKLGRGPVSVERTYISSLMRQRQAFALLVGSRVAQRQGHELHRQEHSGLRGGGGRDHSEEVVEEVVVDILVSGELS